ncbi:hypothetical protein GPJ56_004141 [Histomonas meleagridis]|uniref:uncharacterized protein n=1 Tax=Histomonas meleagridis TaxID=135588 RepID=UPI00355947F1|nr:hypothetical protein GPJ56_004141 [Histomonas meleagridis]KAH0801482.1 hypothetical protein GO595_005734 [Histomonas meleagridis]
MSCYIKVHDDAKTALTAMKAARLYLKSASYFYQVSRNINDTWQDNLTDAFHCYKIAIDLYTKNNQGSLAIFILLELAKNEMDFELFRHSGETYEEACHMIILQKMPIDQVFEPLFNTVEAYAKSARYDLAYKAIEKVTSKFTPAIIEEIHQSPIATRQYDDLTILKAELLLLQFKYDDCLQFSNENLNPEVFQLFVCLCDSSRKYKTSEFDAYFSDAKSQEYFNQLEVYLLELHLSELSKSSEAVYSTTLQ